MLHLDPDTMVMIDELSDGKFTFRVKFQGVTGPTSRPMESREDVELLGTMLLKHLERDSSGWTALAKVSPTSTL